MASSFPCKWLLLQRNFSISSRTSHYCLMSFRSRNRTVMNALEFKMGYGREGLLTSGCCAGFSSVAERTETSGGLHSTLLGPSVRLLLQSYGLQTNSIQPSGDKGQLLKGDVLKYIHENAKIQIDFTAQPRTEETSNSGIQTQAQKVQALDSGYTDIALSNARQTIAKQVTMSKKTIPHVYSTVECNMDKIFILHKKLKEFDIVVSMNDFIIKAACVALGRVPMVNSYWSENGPVTLDSINIAVALTSPNGLVTPVINNASELNVQSISSAVQELADHARKGQLQLHELQGGSFTISNLGMFGVKHFTAIISPQQTGILAVGKTEVRLNELNQKLTKVMTVTLCCDGRVVDEQLASTWLKEFQGIIENPVQIGL